MRRKILRISSQMMAAMINRNDQPYLMITSTGWPADARIVDARYNGFSDCIELAVESVEFDEVSPGCVISEMSVYHRVVQVVEPSPRESSFLEKVADMERAIQDEQQAIGVMAGRRG